jgi:disulfide bond formation protein DsbB
MPANDSDRKGLETAAIASSIVAAVAVATLAGAWFFQYVLKLPPCPLCLDERVPYYVAVPLAILIGVAARRAAPRTLVLVGLLVMGLVMAAGAALGVYHSGVEWQWWPGPRDCSGPLSEFGDARDLLKQLQSIQVVRCDEAAWRFLGLSLAGYNALISLGLAAVTLWAIVAVARRPLFEHKG